MKIDFKNPKIKWTLIILGLALLLFIAFKIGQRNSLEVALQAIDDEIAETSSTRNPSNHLKLLAKRKVIQGLINKL